MQQMISKPGLLAFVLLLATGCYFSPERRGPVEEPFARAERELREAKDEYGRWLALTNYALAGVDRVPNESVREHANEILSLAPKYRTDWNYGNAIHKANLALGRIALRESDVGAAKQYLERAGQTPGSPQLDSFGPNMTLAKELLDKGEREAVLRYFELCGKFWDLPFGKLSKWTKEVEAGKIPDFEANLHY